MTRSDVLRTRRAIHLFYGHARESVRRSFALLRVAATLPGGCSVSATLLHVQATDTALEAIEWRRRARELRAGLSHHAHHEKTKASRGVR